MKNIMMSMECTTDRRFLQMLTITATTSLIRINTSVFSYWDRAGFLFGRR